ncbi:MAG: hypothetical protein JNJ56_12715 [Ignavibacteria bacterium]|nr:hypothetical protein [Ignavibacteria bacterium]
MDDKTACMRKRLVKGILAGIFLFVVSAGLYSLAVFSVSILVFGCVKSPPDWLYLIIFAGFPLPLLISSVTAPVIYIKNLNKIWIVLTLAGGLFLSCLIFLIWFLILTQYC